MKKVKYIIGGKPFYTKKDMIEFCKGILNTNMGELEGEDLKVMKDVLKMHPRYKEKVKGRKYTIVVDDCPMNPANNQFQIHFESGGIEDFSYYKAINGYSKETKLKQTLRKVIEPYHNNYRRDYIRSNIDKGYLICEETGLKIRPSEAHLDHYPKQFEEIIFDWMVINKLKIDDIKLIPPDGYGFTWEFEDKSLQHSFKDYHNDNVQYRMVLNKVNLQRCKSKVKLP